MKSLTNVCITVFTLIAVTTIASAEAFLRPFVTGKGVLSGKAKTGKADERQFSFSVQIAPDGTVSGQVVLVDPNAEGAPAGEPYDLELDITCMNVVGNVVFFGGSTVRTNDPELVDAAYFSAEDNGNGIDKISRVYFFDEDPNTTGDPQLCMGNRPGDFPMEPILSGDINLRQ